jgi:hypothetical protein
MKFKFAIIGKHILQNENAANENALIEGENVTRLIEMGMD